jgi:hypothetical protein
VSLRFRKFPRRNLGARDLAHESYALVQSAALSWQRSHPEARMRDAWRESAMLFRFLAAQKNKNAPAAPRRLREICSCA